MSFTTQQQPAFHNRARRHDAERESVIISGVGRLRDISRRGKVLAVAGLVLAATFVPSLGATHVQAHEIISDSLGDSPAVVATNPLRLDPSSRGGSRVSPAAPPAAPAPTAEPTPAPVAPAPLAPAPLVHAPWTPAGSPLAPAAAPAPALASADVAAASAPTPDISTPDKFISVVAAAAQESQKATGVPASVTIAQAILESEWGKSGLSKKAQNYFGIKAFDGSGPAGKITMDTWEVFSGASTVISDAFKAYHNLYESVMDHGDFLRENPRYADAFKTTDPKEFARRIHKDGYATDPDYCGKVGNLIDKYNLTRYDVVSAAAATSAGPTANSGSPKS